MPLECVMFCLDTSDYMRNGDLIPSRLQAQNASASSLIRSKLENNAETTVGLLEMAGYKVNVKLSPTHDYAKLVSSLQTLKPKGKLQLASSFSIAQLCLRNRPNKLQRQRIVAYIGSPLEDDITKDDLIKLGKTLRKNNIALTIILFGYETVDEANCELLRALVNATDNNNNSELHIYEKNCERSLHDFVLRPKQTTTTTSTTQGGLNNKLLTAHAINDDYDDDMDEDMRLAIELSKQDFQPPPRPVEQVSTANATATTTTPVDDKKELTSNKDEKVEEIKQDKVNDEVVNDDQDEDEDEELLAAIRLSLLEDEEQ